MSEAAAHCWLARFSDVPCGGRMDRVHLIPKSYMKRELKSRRIPPAFWDRIIWHPSVWVWGCRRHHSTFDTPGVRALVVPRSKLPEATIAFATEFDFMARVERMYK